jgi:predicted nicotinamide N-methyase
MTEARRHGLHPPVETVRAAIRAHTVVGRLSLVPEIQLHLITPECALWRASEEAAADAGVVEPFWAFCWAGGQAVARYVLDHRAQFNGLSVLDFGAGGGVVAIAAALSGAIVTAADIDPFAVVATGLNAELNGVALRTTDRDLVDTDGGWDCVLAGDMTYDAALTARVLPWLHTLSRRNTVVFFGAPRRGYVTEGTATVVATYDAPADNDPGESYLVRTNVYGLGC